MAILTFGLTAAFSGWMERSTFMIFGGWVVYYWLKPDLMELEERRARPDVTIRLMPGETGADLAAKLDRGLKQHGWRMDA